MGPHLRTNPEAGGLMGSVLGAGLGGGTGGLFLTPIYWGPARRELLQ